MSKLLNISEAAALSLHSAVLLAAAPQKRRSAKNMATELQVSEAHLTKVMQQLASQGLVESRRGPKGGFSLTDKGSNAVLLDFFQAVHGRIDSHACLFYRLACAGPCIFGDLISHVDEIVSKRLGQISLSAFAPQADRE